MFEKGYDVLSRIREGLAGSLNEIAVFCRRWRNGVEPPREKRGL